LPFHRAHPGRHLSAGDLTRYIYYALSRKAGIKNRSNNLRLVIVDL
jgi:hypothetical protein